MNDNDRGPPYAINQRDDWKNNETRLIDKHTSKPHVSQQADERFPRLEMSHLTDTYP